MITKKQTEELYHGSEVHSNIVRTPSGYCAIWRKSGRVKVWKTRPEEFKMPITRGLYLNNYLTHDNCTEFHLPEDCKNPYRIPWAYLGHGNQKTISVPFWFAKEWDFIQEAFEVWSAHSPAMATDPEETKKNMFKEWEEGRVDLKVNRRDLILTLGEKEKY